MKQKTIFLKKFNLKISNDLPMTLIAGPCVIESEKETLKLAEALARVARDCGVGLVFKASYDKANRSSITYYRGPGLRKGLKILALVKEKFSLPVLTDVHSSAEVEEVAGVADIIQVPAFLCRQTDLVTACARTGLPVNVKKGQFLAPGDVENIIDKIESAGGKDILLSERGTSFGYHNLVVDFRSVPIMKRTGYPVIFDATHSVQLPQGSGNRSAGNPEFIEPLAMAAAAVGAAGLFIEVHADPARALSDGANSLKLSCLESLLRKVKGIDDLVKENSRKLSNI